MAKWDLPQEYEVALHSTISVIYHINKMKKKSTAIIAVDGIKASDQTQHSLMKSICKLGLEGNAISLI